MYVYIETSHAFNKTRKPGQTFYMISKSGYYLPATLLRHGIILGMKQTYRVNFLVCFFLAMELISVLTACTRTHVSKETKSHWLRLATATPLVNSDWNFCHTLSCTQSALLIMEGLLRQTSGNSDDEISLEPALAASWTLENDHLLKIVLKNNIQWSNQTPLVAADFLEAWKKVLSSNDEENAKYLFPILNAKAFFQKKIPFKEVGIAVLDQQNLMVHLSGSSTVFLKNLTHPSTWPISSSTHDNSVTLGPFLYSNTKQSNQWKLIRNPKYRVPSPFLDGIEIKFISSANSRSNLFTDQEVDVADQLPIDFWNLGAGDSRLKSTHQSMGLYFNTAKKPFQIPGISLAFTEAFDRQEWKDLLRLPLLLIKSLDSVDPLGLITTPMQSPPVFALSKAKEALESFRMDDTNLKYMELERLHNYPRITLAYVPDAVTREIASNLQAQWQKNLGVRVELMALKELSEIRQLVTLPSMLLTSVNTGISAKTSVYPPPPLAEYFKPEACFPLYSSSQVILISPKVRALGFNPSGGWDFSGTSMEG